MAEYVCSVEGCEIVADTIYHRYARLSPNPEGHEKEVASVDRQLREEHAYIHDRLGGVVGKTYRDDGVSATKKSHQKKRLGFLATIKDLGPEDNLVPWHFDRYIRTTGDLMKVLDSGFYVYAIHAGHFDLSTPTGRALAKTVVAWAEHEGELKAVRQKSAHKERADEGRPFWTVRPFGYNMDGTPHKAEAKHVKWLYRRVLIEPNLSQLARELNQKGVTTTRGKPWRGTSVRQLLLAARNANIITYNWEEVGPGNWTPLIDEETYRRVAKVLRKERRFTGGARLGQGGRLYLMTGMAQCGTCHRPVVSGWHGGREDGYRVYKCHDGHVSALADWVDDRVSGFIIDRFASNAEVVSTMSGEDAPDTDRLRQEIERLEAKGKTYAEMLDNDEWDRETFTENNKKNRDKIAALRRELGKVGLPDTLHDLLDVDDVALHWENKLTMTEKNAVVVSYFDRVVIRPRGLGRRSGMLSGDVEFWVMGEEEPRS